MSFETLQSSRSVIPLDSGLTEDVIIGLAERVKRVAHGELASLDTRYSLVQSRPVYAAAAKNILEAYNTDRATEGLDFLDTRQKIEALNDIVDYATGLRVVNRIRRKYANTASDVILKGAKSTIVHYRNGDRETHEPMFSSIEEMGTWLRNLRMHLNLNDSPFDINHPSFDARLPDGIRINALHSANDGYSVALRIPNREITTLHDLLRNGTVDHAMYRFLLAAVESKLNIIIAGGTGAGKTALMLCMLAHLKPLERVITIEDRIEIDLEALHPHIDVTELEAVAANADGVGEVSARDLLKASLRQHPDRIVVGEARDEIARELLEAMSTGNEGSLSTLHARSTSMIIDRLVECARLPRQQVYEKVRNAVHLFVHIDRFGNERRVTQVSQVTQDREDDQIVRLNHLFSGGGAAENGSYAHCELVSRPRGEVAEKLAAVGWKA